MTLLRRSNGHADSGKQYVKELEAQIKHVLGEIAEKCEKKIEKSGAFKTPLNVNGK